MSYTIALASYHFSKRTAGMNTPENTLALFIANELNKQQHAAVTHKNGALLVTAGAGSGKTRVITARIAHMMATHSVPASAIVALTFTNKAANEMKQRVRMFRG